MNGSSVARAMAGTAQGNVATAVTARRIADDRDYAREVRANQLYEELRLVSYHELEARASMTAPRQQLIAWIIERDA